jgi:ubiquinone/menaquinone biosynthesis C-methylase UbiE
MVEMDNPFTKANQAAVIVRHLGLQSGMAVLDAGCGPGRLTLPVARAVGPQGDVVAMDIQAGMLDRVREKARTANLSQIRLVEAGLGEGKLPIRCFDRALMVTVLGEIPDQEMAMKEVFASLKPGGLLSVTETVCDPHFQSRRKVTRIAGAAGFKEEAFFGNRIAFTLHLKRPYEG